MPITIDQVKDSREKAAILKAQADEAKASLDELTARAFSGSLTDVSDEEWGRINALSDALKAARRSAQIEEIVHMGILETWFDEIELEILSLMAADAGKLDDQKPHYKKPARLIDGYAETLGVNVWLSERSGSLVIEEPEGPNERRVPVCVSTLEQGKYTRRFSAERIIELHEFATEKANSALSELEIRELAISMLAEADALENEKARLAEKIEEARDKYRPVFGCSIQEIEGL